MVGARRLLSGRYAFQGFLKSYRDAPRWLALEAETGRRVVAVVIPRSQLENSEAARGATHRHLAALIDVLRHVDAESVPEKIEIPTGAGVAVSEYVAGRSLRMMLGGKPMSPAKAVAWSLRLIDAVQVLHAKNAFHGAISAWSVIAEPEGRAIAPVLSQLVAPPIGAFCPPERLKGAAESKADDVWALHALLYLLLTGSPPFEAATREALSRQMSLGKPKPLREHGLDEPALSEIVERGLIGEKRLRVVDLAELSRALDGWERDPRALPAKRALLPRPAPRTLIDIAAGTGPGAQRDDGIVIDESVLSEGEGTERLSNAGPAPHASTGSPAEGGLGSAARASTGSSAQAGLGSASRAAPRPPPLPLSATARAPDPLSFGVPPRAASLSEMARELPPLPVALVAPVPAPSKRLSFNPFERKRRVWPLVLVAAIAGGGGVYLAVGSDAADSRVPAPAIAPLTLPKLASVAKRKPPAEDREACVRSYFPDGSFEGSPSFAFVCAEGDFREQSQRLFRMLTTPATTEAVDISDTAMKVPSRALDSSRDLGWYELAATAIIRKSCCASAAPPSLPETSGWCEQLTSVVRRIGDESAKAGDLAPHAKTFEKAVKCLFANRIGRPYSYERPPNAAQRASFQQFLSRAAVSEARR